MGFIKDLLLGNQYEKKAVEVYKKEHPNAECEIIKGYHKEFDIVAREKGVETYIEVKCDRLAERTGNVAIEYRCNGVGSGITTTLADYYYYFLIPSETCYAISTDTLRDMIRMKEYKRTVKGGDGWRSEMYLFDVCKFNHLKKSL